MKRVLKFGISLLVSLLVTVAAAEAGSITIVWDANTEPDLAGYVVSYGTASSRYDATIDVGPATTWTLTNTVQGRTYFFTVQAYNRAGLRSERAIEVYEAVPATPTAGAAPFGVMDTPVEGASGIAGSLAVGGWALDDSGPVTVAIYRDPVAPEPAGTLLPVGNAVFVEGARTDVANGYPTYPNSTRAGWGYLLLTNMLPNRGNGTYRLHAIAIDAAGQQTMLGSRTVSVANDASADPFGAIDTPGQGETVSGTNYLNWGWVLSPGARRADPPGGGSVSVIIDGVAVGTPAGWTSRSDLTPLFPVAGYSGVNTAVAVFTFDTTRLANGVHTIAWTATDNQTPPHGAGIGSRYFVVNNGAASVAEPMAALTVIPAAAALESVRPINLEEEVAAAPRTTTPVFARRSFSLKAPFRRFQPGVDGSVRIDGEELDRFEVNLGRPGGQQYSGYLRSGDHLAPLPVGSRLDTAAGVFTWQPGVGFIGSYDLVFVRRSGGTIVGVQDVRIVLNPKSSGRVGPQVVIDTPSQQEHVGDSFLVAGWAVDLDAETGSGVDTLHVWAYPATGADPIFLGVADRGGIRPDVASLHGDRFRDAGYGLIVKGLAPGDYNLAVFAWSTALGGWAPARTAHVTVR
jgi:hypothetical protein